MNTNRHKNRGQRTEGGGRRIRHPSSVICLLCSLVVFIFAGIQVFARISDPVPIPAPVEVKPVLVKSYTWSMYGKPIAYYQRVKMPDGSIQELKIKPEAGKVAPDAKQWQALVDKQWASQKLIVEAMPKPCPYCGGTGVMP